MGFDVNLVWRKLGTRLSFGFEAAFGFGFGISIGIGIGIGIGWGIAEMREEDLNSDCCCWT